jgi:predicted permease
MKRGKQGPVPHLVILVAAIILSAGYYTGWQHLPDFLFWFFWPAVLVASLLSGNVHNFSSAAAGIAFVIEIYLVLLLAYLAAGAARREFLRRSERPRR